MPVLKLTQQFINTAKCPADAKRIEFVDTDAKKMYYLLSSTTAPGEGTYYLRSKINGKSVHTKIGRASELDLSQARGEAKRLAAEIQLGRNPQAESHARKDGLTFGAFFNDHYMPYVKPRKRSWKRDEELFRLRIEKVLGATKLDKITRQQLQLFHTDLRAEGLAPATCDHHLKLINAIAVWNQSGGSFYTNRYVNGVGWGTTTIIDSNGPNYSGKVAIDNNGNAMAIWGNYSCNSYNIQFSRYSVGTGWSAVKRCYEGPNFVNSGRDYASDPQLVSDNNGTLTAVWTQYDSIYAANYSPPVSPSDCIFNWGEKNYPNLFSPIRPNSNIALDYYYRYYSTSNSYLATASRDNHLYYMGSESSNTLLDLGPVSGWLVTAGCN